MRLARRAWSPARPFRRPAARSIAGHLFVGDRLLSESGHRASPAQSDDRPGPAPLARAPVPGADRPRRLTRRPPGAAAIRGRARRGGARGCEARHRRCHRRRGSPRHRRRLRRRAAPDRRLRASPSACRAISCAPVALPEAGHRSRASRGRRRSSPAAARAPRSGRSGCMPSATRCSPSRSKPSWPDGSASRTSFPSSHRTGTARRWSTPLRRPRPSPPCRPASARGRRRAARRAVRGHGADPRRARHQAARRRRRRDLRRGRVGARPVRARHRSGDRSGRAGAGRARREAGRTGAQIGQFRRPGLFREGAAGARGAVTCPLSPPAGRGLGRGRVVSRYAAFPNAADRGRG